MTHNEKTKEIRGIEARMRADADRLANLRKGVGPVRPRVDFAASRRGRLLLDFSTPEQAEKAKTMLGKMEFDDPPFREGETVESLWSDGCWRKVFWVDRDWFRLKWAIGQIRSLI